MFIGSYSAPVAKSLKAKVMASLLALAAAVALPQAAHLLGYATGTGNAIGTILLPMHFAIIALGLFAGPYAGLVAGAMSPVVSYMLTGMPSVAVLPFMVAELAGYGFAAGLVASKDVHPAFKVAFALVAGRLLRTSVTAIAVFAFGVNAAVADVWTAVVPGIPGILLQLILIPLIVRAVERAARQRP